MGTLDNAQLDDIRVLMAPFLEFIRIDAVEEWVFLPLPHSYFINCADACDSAIYIISAMYFHVISSPIYLDQNGINRIRTSIAYWIICENLPC